MAADNKMLGQFDLVGLPPAPRGVPQIEVAFDIDANGIVDVSAVDKSTGKKQNITIRSSGGLSDAEIEKMVQDAEAMRDQDQIKKDTVTAKNEAETMGYQVEKQLGELKEKMSTADADELKKKLEDLRAFMATDSPDLEELKKLTSELQEKSWAVTQAAYQSSSAEGGGDEKTSEGEKKDSEDKKEEKNEEKEKK